MLLLLPPPPPLLLPPLILFPASQANEELREMMRAMQQMMQYMASKVDGVTLVLGEQASALKALSASVCRATGPRDTHVDHASAATPRARRNRREVRGERGGGSQGARRLEIQVDDVLLSTPNFHLNAGRGGEAEADGGAARAQEEEEEENNEMSLSPRPLKPTQGQDDLSTLDPIVGSGISSVGEGNCKEEGNLKQHVMQVRTRTALQEIQGGRLFIYLPTYYVRPCVACDILKNVPIIMLFLLRIVHAHRCASFGDLLTFQAKSLRQALARVWRHSSSEGSAKRKDGGSGTPLKVPDRMRCHSFPSSLLAFSRHFPW